MVGNYILPVDIFSTGCRNNSKSLLQAIRWLRAQGGDRGSGVPIDKSERFRFEPWVKRKCSGRENVPPASGDIPAGADANNFSSLTNVDSSTLTLFAEI